VLQQLLAGVAQAAVKCLGGLAHLQVATNVTAKQMPEQSGKAGTRVWISELERTVQVAITDLKMKEG
jgi:hypothetical protein